MIAKIPQAKNISIRNTPSMPDVSAGINSMLSPLLMEKLQTTIVDGLVQSVPVKIETLGAIQPLGPRELKVKTEGERAWAWYQLHTATNVNLKTSDRIKIQGVKYKVMAKFDYSRSEYFEFHIIEDFEDDSWD